MYNYILLYREHLFGLLGGLHGQVLLHSRHCDTPTITDYQLTA